MKKLIIILILIATPLLVNAAILDDASFLINFNSSINCIDSGNCSLNQGLNTFIVITKWALGILGSISLLFFIIGGFMWLTSGGKADQIAKGKSIMINTVFGIAIVMGAWMMVQVILTSISDRTLVDTTDSALWTDIDCRVLNNGDECFGANGICEEGRCRQKCNFATFGGGLPNICTYFYDCKAGTEKRRMCFGSNEIVCCEPEL